MNEPGTDARRLRVMLVYPPSRTQVHSAYPLGITTLAGVLERAGHDVCVVDANAARRRRTTEDIVEHARQWRPDVVGMTLVTPLIRESYRLATALRATGAKLLGGGPHATLVPEEPLRFGFDAVVVGEGDLVVDEVCRALAGQIPMASARSSVFLADDGSPVHTTAVPPTIDLDTLPLPARHFHDAADYGGAGDPSLHQNVFSSRGCTAKCTYCAGALFGKSFRFRSAKSILDEITLIRDTYGTRHFHFVDDAMSFDKKRMRALCEGFLALEPRITWSMMTRIDLALDESMLELFARAGCVRADFGVETGDRESLRRIMKPHTLEMVQKVIPAAARLGIKPNVFFILGFPWDSHESIAATRRQMEELAPYVACYHPAVASVLIPFPGSRVYEEYKDEYGFANWWLDPERSIDAPDLATHSYFETKVFAKGAALDADFFRYPEAIKKEIRSIFKLMYVYNLRPQPPLARIVERALLETSFRLAEVSRAAEHAVFAPLVNARSAAANVMRHLSA
jgi:anaerobic magnesium-protoporphyrin IX monomethyl ester cyclase